MALAKLWTALFGKREESARAAAPVTGSEVVAAASADGLKVSDPQRSSRTIGSAPSEVRAETAKSSQAPKVESKSPKSDVVASSQKRKTAKKAESVPSAPSLVSAPEPPVKQFQRRQTTWTKRLGHTAITSILDLTVADGSHFVELMEAVVDSNSPALKYVAISRFEMDGQPLTLQQFHKRVRLLGGAPVAIPMELSEGLRHLSQTIGTVDLILLNHADQLAEPTLNKLLKRVMRPSTLVFARDAKGSWLSVASAHDGIGQHGMASKAGTVRYSPSNDAPSQPAKSRKAA